MVCLIILISIFSYLIKKAFHVKNTNLVLSYDVKEKYKRIDGRLRTAYFISFGVSVLLYGLYDIQFQFYFTILIYSVLYIIMGNYRLWKYAEHPKAFIFNIFLQAFTLILLFFVYRISPVIF